MRVLGIETSCDETGIAIYCSEQGLLAHALYSQIQLHQKYGGVVPELASRDHLKHLTPLLNQALHDAKLRPHDLDAVAYTAGPGLIGALLTGACFAKSLAYGLNIPALAVHHLEAHVLVSQLDSPSLQFPFLILLVSGGHTQILEARALGEYTLLGETLDDAVGEAFDKTAKLMGFPYPGGPKLAALADTALLDDTLPRLTFPRPMTDRPGLDFSFSGLKTHALNAWQRSQKTQQDTLIIAHAFQEAVTDTLVIKCQRALRQLGHQQLVIAGGVGANRRLREKLAKMVEQHQGRLFFPPISLCTDNGVMVAYTGCQHLLRGQRDPSLQIDVKARWPLDSTL